MINGNSIFMVVFTVIMKNFSVVFTNLCHANLAQMPNLYVLILFPDWT